MRAVVPRPHSFRATPSVGLAASSRACLAAVDAPAQVFPRSVRSSSCVSQPIAATLPCSFWARYADLGWANLAEGRLRLDRLTATNMATIGSFKKSENGDYAGAVKTLTLNVKARITPVEKTNDKAPDFRIYAGRSEIEFGAAWKKTSNEGREYLSVKLDDPSFPAPIYASLVEVEGEDGLSLIWSRRNGD